MLCCAVAQAGLVGITKDLNLLPHKISKRELEQMFQACLDAAQTSVNDVKAFSFYEFKELVARSVLCFKRSLTRSGRVALFTRASFADNQAYPAQTDKVCVL